MPRFVTVNEQKDGGVAASKNPLKWLKGFLKAQRISKSSVCQNSDTVNARDNSKGPKLTCKAKPDEDPTWKIGKVEFADDEHIETMRNMPLQSRAAADQWLCKLVGFDWNTDTAFAEFDDGDLFYCNRDGTVEGVTSAERRFAEQRESEKVEVAVEKIDIVSNETMSTLEPPTIVEPEPMEEIVEVQIEPEPEPTRPQHGDVREDGKLYFDKYGQWFPKDRWDNLERLRQRVGQS